MPKWLYMEFSKNNLRKGRLAGLAVAYTTSQSVTVGLTPKAVSTSFSSFKILHGTLRSMQFSRQTIKRWALLVLVTGKLYGE